MWQEGGECGGCVARVRWVWQDDGEWRMAGGR